MIDDKAKICFLTASGINHEEFRKRAASTASIENDIENCFFYQANWKWRVDKKSEVTVTVVVIFYLKNQQYWDDTDNDDDNDDAFTFLLEACM